MKYKCVVLGDTGVGKTTLCHALKLNRGYFPSTDPTIGAAFFEIKDRYYHRVCIWDTAGQEKYNSLVPLYIRGCDMIIFVMSIDNRKSLDNLKIWYNLVKEYYPEKLPKCVIVINKIDLCNQDLKILNPDNIEKKIKTNIGDYKIVKCSGRLGKGIKELKKFIFDNYYDKQNGPSILNEEYLNEDEYGNGQEYEYLSHNSCTYKKPIDKSWNCC